MAQPVVMGAQIMCDQGVSPAPLLVTEPMRPVVEGRPVATVTDTVPMANIPPFGMCRSLANPAVAAATSAALGVLTPMPCTPVITGPWMPGSPVVLASNKPVLTNNSMCVCAWGGTVKVVQPGAVTTSVS